MIKRLRMQMFVGLIACTFCALRANAQTVTGGVTGTVTDPSGAAVRGAGVTAHDLDTNVSTPTTTNADGVFHIEHLPIGRYEVIVNANGFSRETLPSFSLEALQTVTFNAKLAVEGSTTSVEVSSAAPILDTQDYTISSTFTANTIANFPLNGLDFSALTLYTPGAVSTYGNTATNVIERDTYYSDSVNVNGNRAQANNYTLEGIDMNETFNNEIAYSPAPAALDEIQVVTANSPADLGNVNGAGVVSVLRSGTNHLHGSLYGYLQDYRLNANSWQNKNQSPVVPKNPFSQDQFGATLGGPIVRNKLFFFVDYLGSRYHVGGIGYESVLTAAMRNGDFSALLPQGCDSAGYTVISGVATCNSTGSPDSYQLYDTLNNNKPFVGNVGIPITNPVAKFLFANSSLYPLPNATPTDGIVNDNYQGSQRSYKANNQGDIKLEYDKSDKDKLTGFYSMSTAYDGTSPLLAISFSGPNLYPTKLGGLTWVHTFSPAFVNSLRVGFTRVVWAQNFSVDSTGQFGLGGDAKVGISFPNQSVPGYTYQSIGGGIFAGGNPVYGGGLIDNTYQYMDSASWQHGRHYFSFGISALRYQNNYPTANNNGYLGNLNYNGQYTSDAAIGSGGYGGADFLLGRITSAAATLASVNVGQRQWRTGFYATDDFKVTPSLTVHYGFRYELDEPWIEENNKTGNVNLTTGQIIYASRIPAGAPPNSGLCSNRGCYDWSFHQFMPRVGFAWQVDPRFVVRGGYSGSSFFEGNSSNQRLTSITPFIQAIQTPSLSVAAGNVPTPYTTQSAFDVSAQPGGTYNTYPQNMQPAYVQNYNFTLEYALTHLMSLQVGYVGETGQHIEDYGNVNQWKIPGDPTSAPFYNSPYIGCNSPQATQVCSNGLLITESRAMMNYNGLQTVLRQRLSDTGLEYTVNYTYSKSMTNAVGNYGLNTGGFNADPGFQNYYNSHADYGVAGSDVKHNLNGTATYALPLGHGRKYMNNANRIVDEVLGGWKASAGFMFYSGFPQTIGAGNSNVNSYGQTRAEQYRPLHIVNRSRNAWFGTDPSAQPCTTAGVDNGVCAFGVPAQNTFGNSVNGVVRGPGFRDVDLSGFKDFRIVREQFLGFRVDAFNAFNIVSFGNPDLSMSPQFGWLAQENQIRSVERHLQFSADYRF
ncbi:MAG TPA: carboxypeptidase-like regulatory domain-containing protein [Acidobacteriaceae bacterium]|nr:carboxypeptidase-like regulatory domain-containing protein [Acidobacteriaceae bacterium]